MIEAVGVVVPANDEEQLIGPCIAALEQARAHVAQRVETYLVVVLDACVDGTRTAAERALRGPHCVLSAAFANVGKARAYGAAQVLRHFAQRDASCVWLATTDADSRVEPHWLADHLEVANAGAHGLAGAIDIDDWHGYTSKQIAAFRAFYAAHSASPVHGSNLGVRADAYLEAGGFAGEATGEDHALWNALRDCGKRLVSGRGVVVKTSSRWRGRAPGGFAGFLADHRRRVP